MKYVKKQKRKWFPTLAEKKAWEEKTKEESRKAIEAFKGEATKVATSEPEKEVTAKSKNYLLNGANPKGGSYV